MEDFDYFNSQKIQNEINSNNNLIKNKNSGKQNFDGIGNQESSINKIINEKNSDTININICKKIDLISPEEKLYAFAPFVGYDVGKSFLCGTCVRVKVERSNRCKQCVKCILKMDHHCP